MSQPIRWGVLGAARIAQTAVCPAIHLAEGAVLAALATTNPARAGAFTAQFPGLRLHAGYQALLDDPAIDAVYIPLPNDLHVPWTTAALAAGKHVLCEKPIALQAGEIDGLIAARDATGRLAAEAFMVVHHPQWRRVRALLAEDAIGRLVHVEGAFAYPPPAPGNYRHDPGMGGGALRDIGVYPAVTTRFATGAEPARVEARIDREGGVDRFARVWAEFAEFTLSFYVSMALAGRQEMVFHGTEGVLRLPGPFRPDANDGGRIEWQRADGSEVIERFPRVDQYRLMVEAFGAAARGSAPFACPLEFSRGNQAMIDAILAADPG